MIKDKTYYELRFAMLVSKGETKNAPLINKVKRKLRKFED
jgi:ribonuclease P protein component